MKTLLTVLVGAALGVGGIYLYQKYVGKLGRDDEFIVQVAIGQRVRVKDVPRFEELLKSIKEGSKEETFVNLLPEGKPEEEGPIKNFSTGKYEFREVPANAIVGPGPDGSIHNTQTVRTTNKKEFQAVIELLEFPQSGSPSSATTTLTPTPTP